MVPTGADKAYGLLLKAMEEEKKVGIARCVFGSKETLIALRAKNGELIVNTLYFDDEVQANPAKVKEYDINKKELDMAKMLIEGMTEPFDIATYEDEYRKKVLKAIEDKVAGKEIVAPAEKGNKNKVIDLMKALEMSLKTTKQTQTKKKKVVNK